MTKFAISADIRAGEEKTSHIRASKRVPGIVYGKTQEPVSLVLDASDFLRLYRKAGESNIITLSAGKLKLEVLIHSTQKHPVTGDFTHVDFYAITRGEKVTTHVHFNFVGVAPATKEGFVVQEVMKEIEVKCLPRYLVDHFDVDLSTIKSDEDSIHVSDLNLDLEKYEIFVNLDDSIVVCSAPRAAIEEDEDEDEVVTGSDEDVESSQEGEEK